MHKKQIILLGLIAGVALVFALLLQPKPSVVPLGDINATSTSPLPENVPISQHTSGKPDSPVGETAPQPQQSVGSQSQASVIITIVQPDTTTMFDVQLNRGDDLCANLVQAKKEGDINSLQIDDRYLETFGSLYVREINGYSNNWTVEVNGTRPEGCSLFKPKAGDQIIWRFSV
ncbi:MAG TPA: DUF4430 domain-containing protein [Candidatus Paceibacterota bacterium]